MVFRIFIEKVRGTCRREGGLKITHNIAIIWSFTKWNLGEDCKSEPDNRCYVFFLQEKMPKRSVGTVW